MKVLTTLNCKQCEPHYEFIFFAFIFQISWTLNMGFFYKIEMQVIIYSEKKYCHYDKCITIVALKFSMTTEYF